MPDNYFRINKKEYLHITDEHIFVVNSKTPGRIPLEFELSEAWGVISILNYIIFIFLFGYTVISMMYYGFDFFAHPINYGGIILLLISFRRVKEGFLSSRTPMIQRSKIRTAHLKSPKFSFPRLVIYFEGPEGKVLRRTFPILYKKEAIPVLERSGLFKD
ncbi:MAG: hypothetical protein M3R27_13850 [Bacteroidota bacterium]|nr:hypothetical protein [Bacteroidota bacterium]